MFEWLFIYFFFRSKFLVNIENGAYFITSVNIYFVMNFVIIGLCSGIFRLNYESF